MSDEPKIETEEMDDAEFLAKVAAWSPEADDGSTHEFVCETCGKTETLTNLEALNAGWDYPPFIGVWGIVSPRTCESCGMETTAYWQLIQGVSFDDLDERHRATIMRIIKEPPLAT